MTPTRQEFYNQTIQHLLNQSKRAVTDGPAGGYKCSYLDPDGNKCAIGHWIPDGHPGQHHKGSIDSMLNTYPDLATLIPDRTLARSLQYLHDGTIEGFEAGNRYFTSTANRIAKTFSLTPYDFGADSQ